MIVIIIISIIISSIIIIIIISIMIIIIISSSSSSTPWYRVWLLRAGGRARRFVFVPPNLGGFTTVHETVGHDLDWLRRQFVFVPPNLLGCSNLFTAPMIIVTAVTIVIIVSISTSRL